LQADPAAGDPAIARLSRPWRAAAALALAVLAANFFVVTEPVRLACSDDAVIDNALHNRPGSLGDGIFVTWGLQQGRFYLAVPGYRLPYLGYRVGGPAFLALGRTVLALAAFGLLGALLARLLRSEAAGWLYALAAFGMLHLPAVPYPVLSYPAYAVGGISLLLACHCFLSGLRDRRPGWLLAGGLFHVYALLCQENFLVFTLVYPGLALVGADREGRWARVARSGPYFVLSAAYVAVYVAFRHRHPSGYAGTQFSPRPGEAVRSWACQTLAALPGFELLANRQAPYPNVGPFWKPGRQVLDLLRALPLLGGMIALGAAAVATGLAARAARSARPSPRIAALCAAGAVLPNLLPALTVKYQEAAHHRYYPYVYSFTAYGWLVGAALVTWLVWAARSEGGPPRARAALPVLGCLLGGLFLSAQASNLHTLALLRAWFN
jgi:hypothetical protein